MMKYVLEQNSKQYEFMGGKATALAKMGQTIDNIPKWFVVSYEGFDKEEKNIKEEAVKEVEESLKMFPDDTYFAIRSSAGNEDSKETSFAGQFDTFLYISKEEVIKKIKEVYLSAFSERIETYRKENHIEEVMVPSVIVQKMVKSEKAGVAFGANPITSNIKEIVINAVYGLGSSLVDGVATADTYTILNGKITKTIAKKDYCHTYVDGEIKQEIVDEKEKGKAVLTDSQILEVKELVEKANIFFGRFQDIEWAYEDGRLYLLQTETTFATGCCRKRVTGSVCPSGGYRSERMSETNRILKTPAGNASSRKKATF